MSAVHMAVPNLVQIRSWGTIGHVGELYNDLFFIYTFFGELT